MTEYEEYTRQAEATRIITKALREYVPDTRYLASVIAGSNRDGILCASVTHSQDIPDGIREAVELHLAYKGYFEVDVQWIIRSDWETQGYKVVRRTPKGNLLSAFIKVREHGRKYPEGEWVIPSKGCGPLTVFRTESAAQGFAYVETKGSKGRITFCIYHCVYKPALDGSLWCWEPSAQRYRHCVINLPHGTKLAHAVKLTSEVLYHNGLSYGNIPRKEKS